MEDHGGVHINSGIPNHAFYLAAIALGGNTWDVLGRIWYITLTQRLSSTADFETFANSTVQVAGRLYGKDGIEQRTLAAAWGGVGIETVRPKRSSGNLLTTPYVQPDARRWKTHPQR